MCLFKPRTIKSQLTLIEITSLLYNSRQFEGTISDDKFKIRERKFLSNKLLFPTIRGTIDVHDDYSNVIISFNVSQCDKVGLGVFFFLNLIIAVLFGAFSGDVLLAGVILLFDIILSLIFLISYIMNCRRAYRKLSKILGKTGDGSLSWCSAGDGSVC